MATPGPSQPDADLPKPQWTHNCRSNLRDRTAPYARNQKWSWTFLLNGSIDGLVYERGALDPSLPFDELKRRSLINERATSAAGAADYSHHIRNELPGFGP